MVVRVRSQADATASVLAWDRAFGISQDDRLETLHIETSSVPTRNAARLNPYTSRAIYLRAFLR